MRIRAWWLTAVVFFILASARFYTHGDMPGASVYGVLALVFLYRYWRLMRSKNKEKLPSAF
jgi:hypothetical protein